MNEGMEATSLLAAEKPLNEEEITEAVAREKDKSEYRPLSQGEKT